MSESTTAVETETALASGTSPTRKPRPSGLAPNPSSPANRRKVHVTLQSKGGVGKTLVASHIAQFLIERGKTVVCVDADPGNHSLSRQKALKANSVELFDDESGEVSVPAIDALMQGVLTEAADVVVDVGASGFQPVADYLIRLDAPAIMAEKGRDLIIHTTLVGGPASEDTLAALAELLTQMPEPARFVVWENEYFGPIGAVRFEDTPVYAEHSARIIGTVRIRQRGRFFSDDVAAMLKAHETYEEAIAAAFVMPAQRLVMVRRAIWEQLASMDFG